MHDQDALLRTIYRDRTTGKFVPKAVVAAKPHETEIQRVLQRHEGPRPRPMR